MNIKDVKEWLLIADADFDSAKILNNAYKKHKEVICYLCAQAAEKYLKGYLVYNDIVPPKTHNLVLLCDKCIELDKTFSEIKMECGFINRYANEIRYPYRTEITEEDVSYVINSLEKISGRKTIRSMREEITNSENDY